MTRAILAVASISVLFALGACSHVQHADHAAHTPAPEPAPVVAPTPSPRPECAPAHVTLYFGEQVASDEPVVTPLLNDFVGRIRACEAAGGELREITIATSADPGQSASQARAQVERRQERVRSALVNAGAPADKITGATETQQAIMGRRADITADLY
jgi:hypothetical protein